MPPSQQGLPVNVLLLSMPDAFEHMPTLAIRMPNGALASLAGNVDAHHRVYAADLVLAASHVKETVRDLVSRCQPDVVGLSVMTFQRPTALKLAAYVRSLRPAVRLVVGGYDASLAPEAYADPALGIDFLVRGEGELTFRELLRALERGAGLDEVAGLSWRDQGSMRVNPARHVSAELAGTIRPPDRGARVLDGYTMLGRQVDVVETSRGCTFDCSFCSIIEMRGRNFHVFPIERVIADIGDARTRGARTIFLVDDNIMLDVKRFSALCRAIVDAGYQDVRYIVQAMTSSLANHGDEIAPLMRAANFKYVFLGIENVVEDDLAFLKAAAKNRERKTGGQRERARGDAPAPPRHVRRGRTNRRESRRLAGVDRGEPRVRAPARGLALHPASNAVPGNADGDRPAGARPRVARSRRGVRRHDGGRRERRDEAEDMEFRRWRAERWMKLRHMPNALRDNPRFVLTHGRAMFAHAFRGCTWKTFARLESERAAFARYRAIRAAERVYL